MFNDDDDYEFKRREAIIDECIKSGYFSATLENGREYVKITMKGGIKLTEYIDNISREILKIKPNWIVLFSLDKLSLIQDGIMEQKYPTPEFALTEMIAQDRKNKLIDVINDFITVLESELIDLPPISPMVH